MTNLDVKIKEIQRNHEMKVYERYEDDVHNTIGLLLSEIDRLKSELNKQVDSLESQLNNIKQKREKLIEWAKFALVGAKHEACKYTEDDPDSAWHCCDWTRVVEEAKRVGVTLE